MFTRIKEHFQKLSEPLEAPAWALEADETPKVFHKQARAYYARSVACFALAVAGFSGAQLVAVRLGVIELGGTARHVFAYIAVAAAALAAAGFLIAQLLLVSAAREERRLRADWARRHGEPFHNDTTRSRR